MSANRGKSKIVNTFKKLYIQSPITQITVTKIIKEAQVNRSTFYYYFKDAYDLQEQFENALLDSYCQIVRNNLQTGKQIANMAYFFARLLKMDGRDFKVLFLSPNSPHTKQRLQEALVPFYREVMGLEDTTKVNYALTFFVGGIVMTISKWVSDGEQESPEMIGKMITALVSDGFLAAVNKNGLPLSTGIKKGS
ncbi:TetR/AcrR family transcriptional regulator [Limosilactobacillus kribbianus]|uniref:TetR/AcrR family transcriptional regulator n=1 Tax=Limosilactobacillus kribbianus TaxID=2982695 RepID=UPI00226441F5|nr:TetR/AcrR family transcriptional regulator [Limosilactobacillus kribbianus]